MAWYDVMTGGGNPFSKKGFTNLNEGGGLKYIGGKAWDGATGAGTSSFSPEVYNYDQSAFTNPNLASDKAGYAAAITNAQSRNGAPNPYRDAQTGLISSYQNTINGTAPSVAQNQLREGADRSLKNSYALAASGRGNPIANMRQAQVQNAATNQATNAQASTLRAQETSAAQQGLGTLTNQGRQQDTAQQAQVDQLTQYYTTLGYNEQQAQMQAQRDLQLQQGSDVLQRAAIQKGVALQNSAQRAQNISGILNGISGSGIISAFSDEKLKDDIEEEEPESNDGSVTPDKPKKDKKAFKAASTQTDADGVHAPVDIYGNLYGEAQGKGGGGSAGESAGKMAGLFAMFSDQNDKSNKEPGKGSKDLYQFMDAIKAYKYNYKDPEMGKGKQYSVMAQDLEKTPVGKAMVEETPAGKMVNYGKGFGAILAAQAQLHERLKALEGQKKKA